jgi:hypothetical protein
MNGNSTVTLLRFRQQRAQVWHLERSVRFNGNSAARASAETLEQGREHDQLTLTPSDAMKVREALEKDHAGAQEGLVDTLLGIVDRAWRRSVHAQERNTAFSQFLGSLQGQRGKILKKDGRTVLGVPSCPDENPRPLGEQVAMGLKVLSRDPFFLPFVGEIDEDGFADQGLQGDAIEGHPAFDDVRGGV